MEHINGSCWTEDEIIDNIRKIVEEYNMDTFPTHKEMNLYYSNNCLFGVVCKHGGSEYFANKMGLKIKDCESKFGKKYESLCKQDIKTKLMFDCEEMKPRYPYDLLINHCVKIDVKVANLFDNYGGTKYWTCNIEKKNQTCDIYVVYCLDVNKEIFKTLIIPSVVVSGKTQLAIGHNSVYNKYENRWDLIKMYNDFMTTTI